MVVNSSVPGVTADMQMSPRRLVEHYPSSSIPDIGRNTVLLRIERPHDHVVWSNWNGRAGNVERVGDTALSSAAKHIYQPGRFVRRS